MCVAYKLYSRFFSSSELAKRQSSARKRRLVDIFVFVGVLRFWLEKYWCIKRRKIKREYWQLHTIHSNQLNCAAIKSFIYGLDDICFLFFLCSCVLVLLLFLPNHTQFRILLNKGQEWQNVQCVCGIGGQVKSSNLFIAANRISTLFTWRTGSSLQSGCRKGICKLFAFFFSLHSSSLAENWFEFAILSNNIEG